MFILDKECPKPFNGLMNREYQNFETNQLKDRIQLKNKFDQYLNIGILDKSDIKSKIEENLFFVTLQLKKDYQSVNLTNQKCIKDQIDFLYNSISADFISNSKRNNLKLLPFLTLYLDIEDSKYNTLARDIEVPHFHGVMLLHPKTTANFEKLIAATGKHKIVKGRPCYELSAREFNPIEIISFIKFDPATSLDDMLSYVTKAARNDRFVKGHGDQLELSMTFPRLPKRLYPFYKYSKIPIFTEDEYASFERQN